MAITSEIIESPSTSGVEKSSSADEEKNADKVSSPQNETDEGQYLRGLALALILTSVLMAMFLVSLVSISTFIFPFLIFFSTLSHYIKTPYP
jgi:hypothetical protein